MAEMVTLSTGPEFGDSRWMFVVTVVPETKGRKSTLPEKTPASPGPTEVIRGEPTGPLLNDSVTLPNPKPPLFAAVWDPAIVRLYPLIKAEPLSVATL